MIDYPKAALAIAEARGWSRDDHAAALAADPTGSSDDVGLTHPTNWLTEEEMEEVWDSASWGFVYPNGAAWKDLADEERSPE